MSILLKYIKEQSDWTVKEFKKEGIHLDYTIESLLEIGAYLQRHLKEGEPRVGSAFSKNFQGVMFSLASYIGETMITNVPSANWNLPEDETNGDIKLEIQFEDGTTCWPAKSVINSIKKFKDYKLPFHESMVRKMFDMSFVGSKNEVCVGESNTSCKNFCANIKPHGCAFKH